MPKWLATNGFKMDDPWICRSLIDNLPPPGYVSILRNLDAKDLLDRHNLLTAQKVGTDSEIRLRLEYELQQNRKLEKKLERRDKYLGNLKARVEELEGGPLSKSCRMNPQKAWSALALILMPIS